MTTGTAVGEGKNQPNGEPTLAKRDEISVVAHGRRNTVQEEERKERVYQGGKCRKLEHFDDDDECADSCVPAILYMYTIDRTTLVCFEYASTRAHTVERLPGFSMRSRNFRNFGRRSISRLSWYAYLRPMRRHVESRDLRAKTPRASRKRWERFRASYTILRAYQRSSQEFNSIRYTIYRQHHHPDILSAPTLYMDTAA